GGDGAQWNALPKIHQEKSQGLVLRVLERRVVGALELDADREVVAAAAAAPGRGAGVPGAPLDRDELHHLAVASDQEVRGDLERVHLAEVGVRRRVEAVGEQALDVPAAVLPGRQADRVHHYEADFNAGRARVLVWRIN